MTVQASGTDAKEIALHFIKLTQERATPQIVKKTIVQAKTLLSSGYKKDEIILVIDHLILKKKLNVYSLGYVSASINNVLREIEEEQKLEKKKELKEKLDSLTNTQEGEVLVNDESKKRNQDKARRLGVQSRLREKYHFDMFERE